MPKTTEIRPDLDRILEGAHPHRRAVIHVARCFDARLAAIDLAVLCFIVARIEEGRPFVSLGVMAAGLQVSEKSARQAIRRLRWAGYVELAFEREDGPQATVFRVIMPHESRFDRAIPRKPRLSEIPEVSREVAISTGRIVASEHDRRKLVARMTARAQVTLSP